jgi:hypothetical protein
MSGALPDASFTALNQWAPVGGIGLSRYGGEAGLDMAWRFSPRASLSLGLTQYVAQYDRGKMETLSYRWSF